MRILLQGKTAPSHFLNVITAMALMALLLASTAPVSCGFPQSVVAGLAGVDAVTFAAEPDEVYVPLEEAAGYLRWRVTREEGAGGITLRRTAVPVDSLRFLVDGTELIAVSGLEAAGARVEHDAETGALTVRNRFRGLAAVVGGKRVEISLAKQQLTAWQGARQVLQTRISSGRGGSTPAGSFKAGPYKARRHYSSRYNNAPMPWSVQVNGHVFIHGFTSVPDYPASHGCIRLPLTDGNPAKFFYEWVDRGTPVRISKE